jgi:ligand-binding SRPBCC domain-containing protein
MPPKPTIERDGNRWRLTMSQWLAKPPAELFDFFGDAHNLETITPDLLSFKVVTPKPIEMKPGTLIDYRLKVRGVPIKWTTKISEWDPPHSFRDEQLKGPYRQWVHTHTFVEEAGGTRCDDVVEYAPPGGPLAPLINKLAVQKDVEQIFAYRAKVLAERFGDEATAAQDTP